MTALIYLLAVVALIVTVHGITVWREGKKRAADMAAVGARFDALSRELAVERNKAARWHG